jgi:hypothetical protein
MDPFGVSDLVIVRPGGTDSDEDGDGLPSNDDFEDEGYDEAQSGKRIGREVELSTAIFRSEAGEPPDDRCEIGITVCNTVQIVVVQRALLRRQCESRKKSVVEEQI